MSTALVPALAGSEATGSRYLADNFVRTDLQRAAREARWGLRRRLWAVTKLPRVAYCGRFLSRSEGRIHTRDGHAYYVDVQTCGSPWACPVCSAVIRQRRAVEVERACFEHLSAGRSVGFLTLTFPHTRGEDLAEMLKVLTACWAKVQQRSGYRAAAGLLDLVGFIRATETTFGAWHGWHPHLHLLLFSDQLVADDQWVQLRDLISASWSSAVVSAGRGRPGEHVGVTLAPVYAAEVGGYLAKVQDHYGTASAVGREMSRQDLKRGRKGSRTPFELAEAAVEGLIPELPLWWEYEAATKGKRSLAFSKSLRDRYLVGIRQDEELARAQLDGVLVATVDPHDYYLLVKAKKETHLLDLADAGGGPAVHAFLLDLRRNHDDQL